ncbi:MAG: ribonuclease HII [Lachnospiraceae bacterium]|nr:ribonuclease HII [Lachnospiraceae bacterium]
MGPYLAAGRDRSVKASVMTKKEERLKKQQEKLAAELDRLENMRLYEKKYESCGLICGIDEAGRGPLAGPVVAGAVILPRDCQILYLNDSKKLTARRRELLYEEIMEKALAVGTGVVSHARIDEINILQATYEAMRQAIEKLGMAPDILLNDAVTIPEVTLKQVPIIKGDAKSVSIAAASVIAKVTRDRMMVEMDQKYPGYGFASNKGYGSAAHIASIREMGPCEIHRKTFIRNFTNHAE